MTFLIAKKVTIYRAPKTPGGPARDSEQTKYYAHMQDDRPILYHRGEATRFSREEAEKIASQLNQLAGPGFVVVDEFCDVNPRALA